MSGPIDPPHPAHPIYIPTGPLLDCSPEAQARRRQLLDDLQARLYGGVAQVSDRNRSVTYRSQADLIAAINGITRQILACEAGAWPKKKSAVYYVPQVKDL